MRLRRPAAAVSAGSGACRLKRRQRSEWIGLPQVQPTPEDARGSSLFFGRPLPLPGRVGGGLGGGWGGGGSEAVRKTCGAAPTVRRSLAATWARSFCRICSATSSLLVSPLAKFFSKDAQRSPSHRGSAIAGQPLRRTNSAKPFSSKAKTSSRVGARAPSPARVSTFRRLIRRELAAVIVRSACVFASCSRFCSTSSSTSCFTGCFTFSCFNSCSFSSVSPSALSLAFVAVATSAKPATAEAAGPLGAKKRRHLEPPLPVAPAADAVAATGYSQGCLLERRRLFD
mmetsp:Transcript_123477/g.263271  ORF Transcript_123477/g.263271 Transcript_123477/m.263271 type:complete len:285 (+) Transcript_123477:283-1137(+)